MKANELRIGNCVVLFDKISKVSELTQDFNGEIEIVVDSGTGLFYTNHEVKRIPLTEEWLLKFGFEDCRGKVFRFKRIEIIAADVFVLWFSRDGDDYYQSIRSVQYIHQLQNLYFALTGEELTIK